MGHSGQGDHLGIKASSWEATLEWAWGRRLKGDIGAKNGECEGAEPLQYWRRVSQAKFLWKGNFEQYKGELDCLESNERSRDGIRV